MMRLMKSLLLGVALAGALQLPAQAAPVLDVVLTHEAESIDRDGVTRSSRYQERMVRGDKDIWLERLLPAVVAREDHEAEHATGEHEHPDLTLAARHITRTAAGKASLVMVIKHARQVVDLQPVDYDTVGFNDCWACAYNIITPAELKAMKLLRREAGVAWYEKQNGKKLLRVQWDEAMALPRLVESRNKDGSSWSRLTVTVRKAQAGVPWQQYKGYQHRDLADFGD